MSRTETVTAGARLLLRVAISVKVVLRYYFAAKADTGVAQSATHTASSGGNGKVCVVGGSD
jgi:hypothetical protein